MKRFVFVVVLVLFGSFSYAQEPAAVSSDQDASVNRQTLEVEALKTTIQRLERRLMALEQRPVAPPTGKQKSPIVVTIENARKQIEASCKETGGRWMWALPLATDPKQQEELKGSYFVGCVGK